MTLLIGIEEKDSYLLCADTKFVAADSATYSTAKLRLLLPGCAVAFSGDVGPYAAMNFGVRKEPKEYTASWVYERITRRILQELQAHQPHAEDGKFDFSLLVATRDGMFESESGGYTYKVEDEFVAVGSGADFAMGYYYGINYHDIPLVKVRDIMYIDCSKRVPSVSSRKIELHIPKRKISIT